MSVIFLQIAMKSFITIINLLISAVRSVIIWQYIRCTRNKLWNTDIHMYMWQYKWIYTNYFVFIFSFSFLCAGKHFEFKNFKITIWLLILFYLKKNITETKNSKDCIVLCVCIFLVCQEMNDIVLHCITWCIYHFFRV